MAFAALSSGVSGLTAFTDAIGVISDNITNVNTVGFKETRNRFSTLVTETESTTSFSPGGVAGRTQTLVREQGLLRSTSSQTDLSVDGQGFFIVRDGASSDPAASRTVFTRAGNFTSNAEGFLTNTAGNFLLGFPMDAQGNIPTNIGDLDNLRPINVSGLSGTAEATSQVGLRANLQKVNKKLQNESFVSKAPEEVVAQQEARKKELAEGCGVRPGEVRWVSAHKGVGIPELRSELLELLRGE